MDDLIISRRAFLKAAVIGAAVLVAGPSFAEEAANTEPQAAPAPNEGVPEGMIKDAFAEENAPPADGAVADGLVAEDIPKEKIVQEEIIEAEIDGGRAGRLMLYNTRTKEKLDVTYRTPEGDYDPDALTALNHFLRCHYSQKEIEMDVQTIEYLNALDKKLGGGNEIHVISGYRSPEYNKLLRKRMRRVARHSLHMSGRAVDFRIPGVPLKKIKKAAMSLKCGGVGYYPRRGFLHIDSGRFRTW